MIMSMIILHCVYVLTELQTPVFSLPRPNFPLNWIRKSFHFLSSKRTNNSRLLSLSERLYSNAFLRRRPSTNPPLGTCSIIALYCLNFPSKESKCPQLSLNGFLCLFSHPPHVCIMSPIPSTQLAGHSTEKQSSVAQLADLHGDTLQGHKLPLPACLPLNDWRTLHPIHRLTQCTFNSTPSLLLLPLFLKATPNESSLPPYDIQRGREKPQVVVILMMIAVSGCRHVNRMDPQWVSGAIQRSLYILLWAYFYWPPSSSCLL